MATYVESPRTDKASRVVLGVEKGSPHPLGASPGAGGVNFSLFSANATGVELLLFAAHDALEPLKVIRLDPSVNKSFHFWHVFVRGLEAGAHYAYRVDGPFDPAAGQRFNRNKVLIDPYARGNTNSVWKRAAACGPDDNVATSMRSVVIDTACYDWEGDRLLNRPMEDSIIYETHVRGFTQSPTSPVRHPGTFLGIIEKIPYLKDLGVTAIELLPVFDFDETAVLRKVNGRALTNYWGYSTTGYFAPQSAFCVSPECGSHLREFRNMVKALHRAGIEKFWTWCSITLMKGINKGRLSRFGVSIIGHITSSFPGICSITWTSRVAGTHSTATIRLGRS